MEFDPRKVLINVRQATTEDLLERCTVFREGMEPEALEIIETELYRRGIDDHAIQAFWDQQEGILHFRGLPLKCSFCYRGAVQESWGWHRFWGLVPIFPRKFRHCQDHLPTK